MGEHPATVKYLLRYGRYLRKQQKYEEAKECYRKSEALAAQLKLTLEENSSKREQEECEAESEILKERICQMENFNKENQKKWSHK